jgi:hypothetical protein
MIKDLKTIKSDLSEEKWLLSEKITMLEKNIKYFRKKIKLAKSVDDLELIKKELDNYLKNG